MNTITILFFMPILNLVRKKHNSEYLVTKKAICSTYGGV